LKGQLYVLAASHGTCSGYGRPASPEKREQCGQGAILVILVFGDPLANFLMDLLCALQAIHAIYP
jgi:hypothetical protein